MTSAERRLFAIIALVAVSYIASIDMRLSKVEKTFDSAIAAMVQE